MTNSKALFRELISTITLNEPVDEISSIVYLFMEKRLGISKTDILSERIISLTSSSRNQVETFIELINAHTPVQYILGESEFYGRPFKVTPDVLIPRPETEELVREVIKFCNAQSAPLKILDIGTGSGCIPVTLALEVSDAEVYATDISDRALTIAKENALLLKASVQFHQHDILKAKMLMENLDVVVSNPPYVTYHEKGQMRDNVIQYEPHLALFVPDDDPLLFYKAIVSSAKKNLKPSGLIAVEINERFGNEVSNLFVINGFTSVEIIKDIFGKERIVKGINA